jgi:hypothetical protein
MKRILLGLSALSLAVLAACGSAEYTPQQIVDKMHEQFVQRASEQLKKMEPPLISTTETTFELHTKPIANLFQGKIDAAFMGKQAVDFRDAKKPAFDANMKLTLDADAPGSLFGLPTEAMQKAGFVLAGNVRSVNRNIYANISELSVRQPAKQAVTQDKNLSTTWYKATFDELDDMIGDAMAVDSESPASKPFTIDSLLEQSIGQYRNSAKEMTELFGTINVWNALELLPEENGMYRVRVEADKKKVADCIEAFMDFAQRQNDPTGMNADLQKILSEQKKEMRADIEKSGKLSGILFVDKSSFEPRGFQGDYTDTNGTKQLTIDMLSMQNGDMHIAIINPADTTKDVRFEKKGEAFTFTAEGQKLVEGTMTEKKLKFTVYQEGVMTEGEVAPVLLTADLDIAKATSEELDLTGKITVPAGGSEVMIKKFNVLFQNDFKDVTVDVQMSATLLGSPAIDVSAHSVRKAVPAVTVEEPSVAKPFSDLPQDYGPMMQKMMEVAE